METKQRIPKEQEHEKRELKQWSFDLFEDQKAEMKRIAEETGMPIAQQVRNMIDKCLGLPRKQRRA